MFDSPFLTPQHPLRASQEVCGSLKSIGYSCIDSIVVLTAFNFNILIYIYIISETPLLLLLFFVFLSLSLSLCVFEVDLFRAEQFGSRS